MLECDRSSKCSSKWKLSNQRYDAVPSQLGAQHNAALSLCVSVSPVSDPCKVNKTLHDCKWLSVKLMLIRFSSAVNTNFHSFATVAPFVAVLPCI